MHRFNPIRERRPHSAIFDTCGRRKQSRRRPPRCPQVSRSRSVHTIAQHTTALQNLINTIPALLLLHYILPFAISLLHILHLISLLFFNLPFKRPPVFFLFAYVTTKLCSDCLISSSLFIFFSIRILIFKTFLRLCKSKTRHFSF